MIHVYKKDEFVRAITLGMTKAGLPDVVVDDFSWYSESEVGDLINIFCQSMAEGAAFGLPGTFDMDLQTIKNSDLRDEQLKSLKANSTGKGYLSLKKGIWEEGDTKNRLIQLTFDRYLGNDIHAKQDRMLGCFLGWEENVTAVRHNEELLEASRKARAKLPELQRAFRAGLQPREFIQVKVPFQSPDGGNEWMWVEITSWKDNMNRGLLENEPTIIQNLHSGQIVDIREEDVFDYIRQYPDGRSQGNTTGEILKKLDHDKRPASTPPFGGGPQIGSQPASDGCVPD